MRRRTDDKDREKDAVTYSMQYAPEYKPWMNLFNNRIGHKDFVKFLTEAAIDDPTLEPLLVAVRSIKIDAVVSGEFTYDDNNNFTVVFKQADGEKATKLPREFYVSVPVFEDSIAPSDIRICMEFLQPKNEADKPAFVLTCPHKERVEREAREAIVDYIKGELNGGFLIVYGCDRSY